jgi:endonuclease YncB( thermonuclease family)
MACQETQTAADAYINGSFSGAFTYYLCQALRAHPDLDSKSLIKAVAASLKSGYEQVPVHEGRALSGPIFGRGGGLAPSIATPIVTGLPASVSPGPVAAGRSMAPVQERLIEAYMKLLDTVLALEASAQAGPATLPDFKVFPKAKFIESRTNEADTLRIKVSDSEDEHVFVLYFVDALDASWTHPQRVQEQSRYFGVSGERVVTEGQRAAAYVSQLLKSHPFSVMTRWEQVPERSRFYALILVEISAGKWVYLADLLVQQGFARVAGVTTSLPSDSRSMNDYALELQTLRKQAEQRKAGVWAASKL